MSPHTQYLKDIHSLSQAVVWSIKLSSEVRGHKVRTADSQCYHGRVFQRDKVIQGIFVREMKENLCQLHTHLGGKEVEARENTFLWLHTSLVPRLLPVFPVFQCVTLKNWEEPGDEASYIPQ